MLQANQQVSGFTLIQGSFFPAFVPVIGANGTAPYTYSISPALPAGLTYDINSGEIGGSPSATSTFITYSVTITDQVPNISTGTFTMAVIAQGLLTTRVTAFKALVKDQAFTPFTPVTASGGYGTYTFVVNIPLPGGVSINQSTGQLSGTPGTVSPLQTYTITVEDEANNASSKTVDMVVSLPMVLTLALPTVSVPTNEGVGSVVPVTVAGGYTNKSYSITPSLPTGLSFNTSTGVISGTPTVTLAETSFTITVNDGGSQTDSKTFALTVTLNPVVTTLEISDKELTVGVDLGAFTPVTATGGGGDITYSVSPSLPAGLTFNTSTAQISGVPTVDISETVYTITATDAYSQSSSKSFNLTVVNPTGLTTRVAFDSKIMTQNVTYPAFATVVASGGYGTLTYSISPELPAGLTFSTTTGKISGTPTVLSPPTSYTITVNDQASQTSIRYIALRVLVAPGLTSSSLIGNITVNRFYDTINSKPVSGTGGYGTLTYSISPELPSNLKFNSATGYVTGIAETLLARVYTITVKDQARQSTSKNFNLYVYDLALSSTATVASKVLEQWYPATEFTPVTRTGGVPSIRFSINPNLPTGLFFNTSTGAISGTPTVSSNTSTYTVTVNDFVSHSTSSNFSLYVKPKYPEAGSKWVSPAGLLFTVTELVSTSTSIAFAETGTTYTVISGELPAGMTLSSTGVISGTPNAVIR